MTVQKFNKAIADFEKLIKTHLQDVYVSERLAVKSLTDIVQTKTATTGKMLDSNGYSYEFRISQNDTELKAIN